MKFFTETKISHAVDWFDLEAFIKEEYGKSFDFVQSQEVSNDSETIFDISKRKLDKYDLKYLEAFKATGQEGWGTAKVLLQDLVNQDKLPEGQWIVSVSW